MISNLWLCSKLSILLVLLSKLQGVNAQAGVTECACYPSLYEFTLDFGATCETSLPGNPSGDGIFGVDCFVVGNDPGGVVEDLEPVLVTNIQLIELNEDLDVLVITEEEGLFRDGYFFNYTSFIAENNTLVPGQIPSGLQMDLTAQNALGQDIVQTWIIRFNNDCGIFPPVINIGDQIGWAIMTNIFDAVTDYCPNQPTIPPTLEPSLAVPTMSPTNPPSIVIVPTVTAEPTPLMSMDTEAPSCPTLKSRKGLSKGGSGGGKKSGSNAGKKSGSSSAKGGKKDHSAGKKLGGGKKMSSNRSKGGKKLQKQTSDSRDDLLDTLYSMRTSKSGKKVGSGSKKSGPGSSKKVGSGSKKSSFSGGKKVSGSSSSKGGFFGLSSSDSADEECPEAPSLPSRSSKSLKSLRSGKKMSSSSKGSKDTSNSLSSKGGKKEGSSSKANKKQSSSGSAKAGKKMEKHSKSSRHDDMFMSMSSSKSGGKKMGSSSKANKKLSSSSSAKSSKKLEKYSKSGQRHNKLSTPKGDSSSSKGKSSNAAPATAGTAPAQPEAAKTGRSKADRRRRLGLLRGQ